MNNKPKKYLIVLSLLILTVNSSLSLAELEGEPDGEGHIAVTICHRMGGAEVTITVDDDGAYNGHINHPLDTLGACDESDSGVVDSGQVIADSSDTDYFIPSCTESPEEREEICDQLYETVDSSYYNDSSDFAYDSSTLSTICSSFFSDPANTGKKMVICHKNKNTLNVASQGACNGHFPNHADDYYGPCVDDSGDVSVNEANESCIADSSALFVSAEDVAADSGLQQAVENCDDSIPVDPESGEPMTGKPGRFNWMEIFN